MLTCRVCGKPNPEQIFHCNEHYYCEDCGMREGLCTYMEGVLCDKCHKARVEKRIVDFSDDTDFTDEVVCPHCGFKYSDSWEMEDGGHTCSDCGNKFELSRDVEVHYSTEKKL